MVGDVDVKYLDLADLSSIGAFAESTESVDRPSRPLRFDLPTGREDQRPCRLCGGAPTMRSENFTSTI